MEENKRHEIILKYIKERITEKPIFLMMVGLSGSGKSTVAEQLRQNIEKTGNEIAVLSSDEIRLELLGDASEQSKNGLIFDVMHKRTLENLHKGVSVIYDATNLNLKDRKGILESIKNANIDCYKIAYIIPTPFSLCVINNSNRNRIVPFEVIKKQQYKFQIPIYQEGFNFIGIEGYDYCDFFDLMSEKSVVLKDTPFTLLRLIENFDQGTHYHKFSLLEHSILTYEEILRKTRKADEGNKPLEIAALLHDFGKLKTKQLNERNEYSYLNHANVGAYDFLQNLDQLGLNCLYDALYCVALINYHMEPFGWLDAKTSTVEKKKLFFGEKMYNELMMLNEADMYASTGEHN